jgi:hypothetical protein
VQHPRLGAARAAPLLAADALRLLFAGALPAEALGLDLLGEQAPGVQAVRPLRPFPLALDRDPRRPVNKHDAGRDLVDVLSPLAPGVHEALLEILLAHTEPGQPLGELARSVSVQGHGVSSLVDHVLVGRGRLVPIV